ncbi:MAG: hypothetical protein Q4D41_03210 [Prevotellaceae bacterium]|nr:hypothetical protein [Prevotellaceae bacterium]
MKKLFLSALMACSLVGANAQDVPYIYSAVGDTTYAVTMTNDEIAANYDAEWCTTAWNLGVSLPAGTVMFENEYLTITAAVQTPVYTSSNKFESMKADFPDYNGYVNLGSSLAQNNWDTSSIQIIDPTEFAATYHGFLLITPKVAGQIGFGVYAGDNSREIGIYQLATDAEMEAENFGSFVAVNNFRNDGENGTVLNAPAYVYGNVDADHQYLLIGGGNKNLTMHQVTFSPSEEPQNTVPYIYSQINDTTYAVTMTNDEIAANYDAEWCTTAWNLGVSLPAGTVMFENDDLTITAAVQTPVYTSSNKFESMKADFPDYNGYVNLGSSLAQNNWDTSSIQIIDPTEFAATYHGFLLVTPKKSGQIGFGVYAGDNSREIGIYQLATDAEMEAENFGSFVAVNNFRNDGENGTVLNAPAYVYGNVDADHQYLLIGGGNKNLTMHQVTFNTGDASGISNVETTVVKGDNKVYSIDGRYVGNSTSGLSKGLYICNGKKFVIK